MLQITIPQTEQYDELRGEFVYTKEQTLTLEHSLISLSKWESKWHKPFLHTPDKSVDEMLDYIRCMTLTQNVDPGIYRNITNKNMSDIEQYINDSMTATTFSNTKKGKANREIITSEIIYYWMITLNIPFECCKWHLNRLIALIMVCNIKNSPGKKMSNRDILSQNAALNAARKKQLNTKG